MNNKLIELAQEMPWAITPDVLDVIHVVLAAKLHATPLDLSGIEAQIGRPLDNTRDSELDIRDGVAVIPVRGILAKRMNLFTAISGGTSTEILKKDIEGALNNPDVEAVILDIDSPGGAVAGTKELATWLYEQRGTKPIYAYANEQMASAAYWIGSAADKIFAQATAQVGSIGVITAHYDYSQYDAQRGVKRTFLTAGKYKAMGNDAEPLSQEARDYIQEHLDQLYTLFIDSVAANRNYSTEHVLTEMADGRIFLAKQAMTVGLIDNITNSLDDLVRATKEEIRMSLTVEQLKAERSDIITQLRNEWKAENANQISEIRSQVEAETVKRLLDLHAIAFSPEESTRYAALVHSGLTAEQLKAATGLLNTEKDDQRSSILAALQQGDPGPVDDTQTPARAEKKESFMDKVMAYKTEHNCDLSTALKACSKQWPDLHQQYLREVNNMTEED
jgi:signal peptide peptidase SppA